jgi:alpha-tubulin suppressor-like RCC1 family protein
MLRFKVKNVSAGEHHSACLTDDGKAFTFGLSHRIPLQVTMNGLSDEVVVKISCGNKHGMILTATGKLYGYGDNTQKQIDSSGVRYTDDSPKQIHTNVNWIDVHAGLHHTMGLDSSNIFTNFF